ncbi:MAG: glucosyl-3-phosphoglycerate synthase, partial [Cyanobacteriota bacterium]|nr:glucosyl-3-phosphoglycerate synthase [Cyanobacteriota bacterium]
FDHKHQPIGNTAHEGLRKMCRDILRSILRTLTEMERVVLTMDQIHTLRVKFRREAQDYTRQYFVDARFNNIDYDRHQEEINVELFEQVITEAGQDYLNNPANVQIPDWTRALAVMPALREQLREATRRDMTEAKALINTQGSTELSLSENCNAHNPVITVNPSA